MNSQLTGSVLEDAWKESGKAHMDELIQRIETILLDATCSRCGSSVPPSLFFFNTPETQHGCFLILPLQGRQADASETCGVAIQRLGSGPRRRACQQRHSGQRSKLLHGECRLPHALCCWSLFLIQFSFCSQNEPTFYTEDGIAFTAADPGGHQDHSRTRRFTVYRTDASQKKKLILMIDRPKISVAEERKVKVNVTSAGSSCCKHRSLNHLRLFF